MRNEVKALVRRIGPAVAISKLKPPLIHGFLPTQEWRRGSESGNVSPKL